MYITSKYTTFLVIFALPILTLGYSPLIHANSQLSISEKDGLPIIKENGLTLLSSSSVFWGESWSWAALKTQFNINNHQHYSTTGFNKKLDFKLNSKIKREPKKITWDFYLDAKSRKENIIGGGIVFKLNGTALASSINPPILLQGNKGWKWHNMEVRFQPALASVYFERGKQSEIRAFFYKDKITPGKQHYKMTVSLSSDAVTVPTLSQRFSSVDSQTWPKDTIHWQTFPIDLSSLNATEKPAGKRGFIKAVNDQLIFNDGTPARFWGTNLTAYSLFKTSKINIKKQAKRLSKMGFNLVRLHHHDSAWVKPNIFGNKASTNTLHLSKTSLDKLDWWIKCLKDEGIYTWLDLHVGRILKQQDHIDAFEEIDSKSKKPGAKLTGYNYVNSSIKNAMKRFNKSYVTHVNPYTKLAYKDEPAIIAMLITNENDITHHFGNKLLPNKKVPKHSKVYMELARIFSATHHLNHQQTWRSWLHGPSKLFLNDLEHQFNQDMINDLKELGVKIPIVTTNTWGNSPLSSLPSLTDGDMIDVHAYGNVLELEKSPLVSANMTTWMAAGQVANKPMSVTEWNISPFPSPDRHSSPLLIASKASHQGWDALMQYAYTQNSLNKVGRLSNWSSHNDPSLLATLPAAALLYRRGDVATANTSYYFSPGQMLFNKEISPKTSVAIRTASEKGKLFIAMPKTNSLPWLKASVKPKHAIEINDFKQSFIKPNATSVTTDTGELYKNWDKGIYTINTKMSQAVMGWVGNKSIKLSDTTFQIKTGNATVAVQSMDSQPIYQTKDILISLGTHSMPYRDVKGKNKLPFHSQPLKGLLLIRAPKGLSLYYASSTGKNIILPVDYMDGQYSINLSKVPATHWLRLKKPL